MDFEPASLLASVVVSLVGFVLFRYGRTQRRFPHALTGLTLMVFPYVVSSAVAIYLIGLGLFGLLWLAVRFGL